MDERPRYALIVLALINIAALVVQFVIGQPLWVNLLSAVAIVAFVVALVGELRRNRRIAHRRLGRRPT